jgi:hypothetical protein
MSGNEVCRTLYRGNPFIESITVSDYIRVHSAPAARIVVMGSEPEMYFYAKRHSGTGYIYTYNLFESQPNVLKMQQEMITQIETSKPEYIVWVGYENSWFNVVQNSFREGSPIFGWFDKYTKEFYERAGVADMRSNGQTVYLWDEEARNYRGPVEDYLVVYKRKAVPEASR